MFHRIIQILSHTASYQCKVARLWPPCHPSTGRLLRRRQCPGTWCGTRRQPWRRMSWWWWCLDALDARGAGDQLVTRTNDMNFKGLVLLGNKSFWGGEGTGSISTTGTLHPDYCEDWHVSGRGIGPSLDDHLQRRVWNKLLFKHFSLKVSLFEAIVSFKLPEGYSTKAHLCTTTAMHCRHSDEGGLAYGWDLRRTRQNQKRMLVQNAQH